MSVLARTSPDGIALHDTPLEGCPIPAQSFMVRGKVTRAKDGDTVIALLDLGGGHLLCTPVRYASIDCWESHGDYPPDHLARGAAAAKLNASLVEGQWVLFHTRLEMDIRSRILADPFVWVSKHAQIDVIAELKKSGAEKFSPLPTPRAP